MKKLLTSAISLLIVLLLVAPTCLSVVSFAADTSEEANVWDKLKPAYIMITTDIIPPTLLRSVAVNPLIQKAQPLIR